MRANFLPALKAEIKAVVKFNLNGDYEDQEPVKAGVIFKVLDQAQFDAYVDKAKQVKDLLVERRELSEKAQPKTAKAIEKRNQQLADIDDQFAKLNEQILQTVKDNIVGYSHEVEPGKFEPTTVTEEEFNNLAITTDFVINLVRTFSDQQKAAARKNS